MTSRSNKMWILAHRDELESLPRDRPFLYSDVDLSFSIFRQAVEREILEAVDETSTGENVWSLNEDVLNEETAEALEKSAEGGGDKDA